MLHRSDQQSQLDALSIISFAHFILFVLQNNNNNNNNNTKNNNSKNNNNDKLTKLCKTNYTYDIL